MTDRADIAQVAGEELLAEAERAAVVDLDDIDREAALAQLHREPDDDQPAWRRS